MGIPFLNKTFIQLDIKICPLFIKNTQKLNHTAFRFLTKNAKSKWKACRSSEYGPFKIDPLPHRCNESSENSVVGHNGCSEVVCPISWG